MIIEAWKLIQELEKHDPYDPIRILISPGELVGVKEVKWVAGRLAIIPSEKTLDKL